MSYQYLVHLLDALYQLLKSQDSRDEFLNKDCLTAIISTLNSDRTILKIKALKITSILTQPQAARSLFRELGLFSMVLKLLQTEFE